MSAIQVIDTVPTYISPEEHTLQTSSTPDSFASIPPILRHIQQHTKLLLDPQLDGFTQDELADGTLFVLESSLTWFSSSSSRGVTVLYPNIALHAVSRAGGEPSIYCQVDPATSMADGNGDEDRDESDMIEMSFVPQDTTCIDAIFDALSLCASLHPDIDAGSDNDEDAFLDASVETSNDDLTEAGRATLDRLESLLQNGDGVSPTTDSDSESSEPMHPNGAS